MNAGNGSALGSRCKATANTTAATTNPSQAARLYVHNAAKTISPKAPPANSAVVLWREVRRRQLARGLINTI
jgi:hypothetical protein